MRARAIGGRDRLHFGRVVVRRLVARRLLVRRLLVRRRLVARLRFGRLDFGRFVVSIAFDVARDIARDRIVELGSSQPLRRSAGARVAERPDAAP